MELIGVASGMVEYHNHQSWESRNGQIAMRPVEAADLLGIGRSKVYEMVGAGVIPSVRIGASVRIPLESLRAWIARQTDDAAQVELSARLDRHRD